jgi:NCAIR mutase (PurE)-related protein
MASSLVGSPGLRRPQPAYPPGVDRRDVEELLRSVATGTTSVSDAAETLADGPLAGFRDLGFARLDVHRGARTGDPEVVYGAGKSSTQVVALLRALREASPSRPALATRLDDARAAAVREAFPDAQLDPVAGCAVVGDLPPPAGLVAVVSAGTSDEPVAAEAALTAAVHGAGVCRISDVGVAGLHRVLAVRADLAAADCVVVVAGMEGALPSVVGGLVGTPVVAVPTSVGYGTGAGGFAALLGMLNACAPGVVVCNIDNGFGAGVFAARVARRVAERRAER